LDTSTDPESELHPSQVIERPKVLFNDKTGKFVMWIHIESPDYEKAHAGVAVSDSPNGPFVYLGSFKPNGGDSRDQTLFKDDDGRAYQIYSSEWNKTMYVGLLSEDYQSHTGTYKRIFIGENREAPVVFKNEGKYYIITSGCTGWDPNTAMCAVADSMLGEWTEIGNPCSGPDSQNTYHAQGTYAQPLGDGHYLMMFDRWNKTDLDDSRYVWLPMTVEDGMPVITWKKSWTPEVEPMLSGPGLDKPTFVYNNWSAYDELSDTIPQTSRLCLQMLDKLIEMKKHGVLIDAYMMDAFWFDPDGGYRVWNKHNWPEGPDEWIKKCLENDIIPGLWFSTNLIMSGGQYLVKPVGKWQESLTSDPSTLSLFEGGYLDDLMEILQYYADMGVGFFKFDFAYFESATDDAKKRMSSASVIEANKTAFMNALKCFRKANPTIKIIGYNGFGGYLESTEIPFGRYVDLRWLDVFDTMYSGDPRFSDVPMKNIWRTEDLYSDHQVRQFIASGIPPSRVDDCSLMIGTTGTCYNRALNAWKSSTVLNLARPGWLKICHGNINLLSVDDELWLARAQKLFYNLHLSGHTELFGGIPGKAESYGYLSSDKFGKVYTVVNPSQSVCSIKLPGFEEKGRILFHDTGKVPLLSDGVITLGPEGMAVIGCRRYANDRYSLGIEEDIIIPEDITPIDFREEYADEHCKRCTYEAVPGTYRVLFSQKDENGRAYRSWGGGPPYGRSMDDYLSISVKADRHEIPVTVDIDKVIWSGLSWCVAEFNVRQKSSIEVDCHSLEVPSENYSVKIYKITESPR